MSPQEFIYLDNFRGFRNTLIHLKDVTFLVGENSTGKSSFLSLVNLLQENAAWNDIDFDSEIHHIGGFYDIASPLRTFPFTVGYVDQYKKYEQDASGVTEFYHARAEFLTFGNDEGLPKPIKYSLLSDGHMVTFYQEGDYVYYRTKQFFKPGVAIKTAQEIRPLINFHRTGANSAFTKLDERIGAPFRTIFPYLPMLITRHLSEGEKAAFDNPYRHKDRDPAVWIAPIRAQPRRTYDGSKKRYSAEGDHAPYLIRKQLSSESTSEHFRTALEKLGKDGALFDGISIQKYGRGSNSPFEIRITLGNRNYSMSSVGYGVAQVLPVAAECISRGTGTSFHIQQPEVHLHPRAQAAFGDLVHALATAERKRFVIETHSDFTIDRFRLRQHEGSEKLDASVLFFERKRGGNFVNEIQIEADGSFSKDQPQAFRDFFISEQINMLKV